MESEAEDEEMGGDEGAEEDGEGEEDEDDGDDYDNGMNGGDAALTGVAIAVATAFKFGSITFSSSQSVAPEDITGLGLYFSVFFLLALPVLGSAARMPGNSASSEA